MTPAKAEANRRLISEAIPWKVHRRKVEVWLIRLLAGAVPYCSRGAILWLARTLGGLAYLADKKGQLVTLANLRVAFGQERSEQELDSLARASYRNLARTFLDLLWSVNIDRENLQQFLKVDSNPALDALRAQDQPVIITGPHFGHWEFANVLSGYKGYEYMLIVNDIKNEEVDRVVNELRERSGQIIIRRGNAVLRLMKRLKAGKTVAFLVDQSLRPERPSVVVKFFGLPVCVTTIQAELAMRTGAPIVHIWCYPEADGTYTIKFGEPEFYGPDADIEEIVQRTMRVFEDSIRERPDLFLWNYKHWRFKPLETREAYPHYSNVSKNFDRKVARAFADREAAREKVEI